MTTEKKTNTRVKKAECGAIRKTAGARIIEGLDHAVAWSKGNAGSARVTIVPRVDIPSRSKKKRR